MTRREFLGRLQDMLSPDLRGEPYYEYCTLEQGSSQKSYADNDFQVAQEMVRRLAVAQSRERPAPSPKRSRKRNTAQKFLSKREPVDLLTSEILVEKITPWVEGLRNRLFNSLGPPFDWNGAVEWIEQEAEKNKKSPPPLLRQKYMALAKELQPFDVNIRLRRALLPYAKMKDPWAHHAYINGPKMASLERETRSIAKATGFNQASLVMFILVGIKPLVARVQGSIKESFSRLPDGKYLSGKEINLTFRACDFSGRELQRLYERWKDELKIKRVFVSTEKHFRVYKLIRKCGEPPGREHRGKYFSYWTRASETWNRRYRDKPRTWQGLSKIYERLMKNIAAQSS